MQRELRDEAVDRVYNAGLLRELYKLYVGAWTTATSRYPIGMNVYEREWDVLVLLDTCRVDALQQVSDEYDFLGDIGKIMSVGSTSNEWIANTFSTNYRAEIAKTAYISANGYTQRVIEERKYPEVYLGDAETPPCWLKDNIVAIDDFLHVDQPWQYSSDDRPGHVSPEIVTDHTISAAREYDPARLVVHYSQPHAPYAADAVHEERDMKKHEQQPFQSLREGESRQKVWDAYINNLRMVLDNLSVLLENIDGGTVAISADHGEAFGEWGIYGHLPGLLHPHVKWVPWVETSAHDSGSYTPTVEPTTISDETEEHLRNLGYQ